MKRIALAFALFLVLLLLFGCIQEKPTTEQKEESQILKSTSNINIEYTESGGIAYFIKTLKIDNEGNIYFENKLAKEVLSKRTTKIERSALEKLTKEIIDFGFFEFTQEEIDNAEQGGADIPVKELSITIDGFTKKLHWMNTSHKIRGLEEKFSELIELILLEQKEEETAWLSIEPIQCQGNAWDLWLKESGIMFIVRPTEKEIIRLYFKNALGIELLDYKSVKKNDVVCQACSCPRGDEVFVKVYAKYAKTLIDLGWKLTASVPET